VLRPSFDGIRKSVCNLLGIRLDKLARQVAATQDVKVKEEIERLALGVINGQVFVILCLPMSQYVLLSSTRKRE
jgi:hypothetical protein